VTTPAAARCTGGRTKLPYSPVGRVPGKGSEEYQIIGDRTTTFQDIAVVYELTADQDSAASPAGGMTEKS
jgi:hypothetical protein